jgi:hypothetical protein
MEESSSDEWEEAPEESKGIERHDTCREGGEGLECVPAFEKGLEPLVARGVMPGEKIRALIGAGRGTRLLSATVISLRETPPSNSGSMTH